MAEMFNESTKSNKPNFLDQVKSAREDRNAEKCRDNAAICIQVSFCYSTVTEDDDYWIMYYLILLIFLSGFRSRYAGTKKSVQSNQVGNSSI